MIAEYAVQLQLPDLWVTFAFPNLPGATLYFSVKKMDREKTYRSLIIIFCSALS